MSDPDLCSDCNNHEEIVGRITKSIFEDKEAISRIRSKILKLGRPQLITFTFPPKGDRTDPKRISIAYDDYALALGHTLKKVSTHEGEECDPKQAANAMLSSAFIQATVRNAVINTLEEGDD